MVGALGCKVFVPRIILPTHDNHEGEEYHEQPKGLIKGGGSVKHKDAPMYTEKI